MQPSKRFLLSGIFQKREKITSDATLGTVWAFDNRDFPMARFLMLLPQKIMRFRAG